MDFRQYYRAAQVILQGDDPYAEDGEPLTAWGGPYPYPPLPALMAAPLTALSDRGSRAARDGGARVRPARRSVHSRSARLALLRGRHALAARDLGDPDRRTSRSGSLWLLRSPGAFAIGRFAASTSLGITLGREVLPLARCRVDGRDAAVRERRACVRHRRRAAPRLVGGHRILRARRRTPICSDASRTPSATTPTRRTSSASTSACRPAWRGRFGSRSALGLLGGVVLLGRRRDERAAFILAIAAALALTPIVWLHYFALLVVVVAVSRPRLGVVWFVPLAMVVTPGADTRPRSRQRGRSASRRSTVGLALRVVASPSRGDGRRRRASA